RRQRTESRPTSFILHAVMEVMQEGALAQNKSLGVTDGDAEREGISSDSKEWLVVLQTELPALIVPSQSRVVLDHKLHLLTLAYSLQSPKVCTRLDRLL
ncbi:hypothetical protein KUCAC02_023230, partial [Chaenocephalus aceratus]